MLQTAAWLDYTGSLPCSSILLRPIHINIDKTFRRDDEVVLDSQMIGCLLNIPVCNDRFLRSKEVTENSLLPHTPGPLGTGH